MFLFPVSSQICVYTCISLRWADKATAATDFGLYTALPQRNEYIPQFRFLLSPIPELLRKLLKIGLDQVLPASSQQRPCGQENGPLC